MSRRLATILSAAALVPAFAGTTSAQDWRTLESSRQLQGSDVVDVRLQYGAGVADIAPASGPWLYKMSLRYDAERTSPIATFDEPGRALRLGTRSTGAMASWGVTHEGNRLDAELTDRAPLRLALELGATQADVELGGLKLRDLDIRTGVSKAYVNVQTPNAETLAGVSLDVGAADMTVRRGGNLRAARVTVNVGVGALDYDFDGDWSGDVDADVNVAMGSLTLRMPADAGVRVTARTFLVDFSRAGLVRRGDTWESPGYGDATRHVRVQARAAFGSLAIVRR